MSQNKDFKYCSVVNCKKVYKAGSLSLHRLSKRAPEFVQKAWRKFSQCNAGYPTICSKHFLEEDFMHSSVYMSHYPKARQKLKPDAIPSIRKAESLSERLARKERKKIVEELLNESENSSSNPSTAPEPSTEIDDPCDQIDIIMQEDTELDQLDTLAIIPELTGAEVQESLDCVPDIKPPIVYEVKPKCIEKDTPKVSKLLAEVERLKSQTSRLKEEKQRLQDKVAGLREKNRALTKVKQEKDSMEEALLETFTQNELDLLLKRKSHVVWRRKEIQEAFLVRYLSKTCYRYLRTKKHYPLPSTAAIEKWANRYGINLCVLDDLEVESD